MITRERYRTIYNVARRARRWTEKHWHLYNADNDMGGMCGVSSTYLLKLLLRENINAHIVECDTHAYVMYQEYIIDVTATQFGGGKIVIRQRRRVEKDEYRNDNTFRTPSSFIAHQLKSGWPENQIYGYTRINSTRMAVTTSSE